MRPDGTGTEGYFMPAGDRFTVSLDTELLAAFDAHLVARGYENRSEAIRDLIRDMLLEPRLTATEGAALGALTIICDHRAPQAHDRLRLVLLQHAEIVLNCTCRPANEHTEILVVILSGQPVRVQEVIDRIQAIRGLSHGRAAVIPQTTSAAEATQSPDQTSTGSR